MPTPNDPGQTPAPDGQTPPTAPVTPTPPDGAAASAIPDWVKDPVAAYAEIQKTRSEAAETRKRLKALEDAAAEKQSKALEEQGKFKELADQRAEELETLRETVKQSTIRNAVLLEAARLNIADPADAYQLANLSGVTIGDDDSVQGVSDALQKLITAKPYLLKSNGATASAAPVTPAPPKISPTNPGGGGPLTADAIAKMSESEIRQLLDSDPSQVFQALQRK